MTAITSSAVPIGLGSSSRAFATTPQALVYGPALDTSSSCSPSIPYSSFIPPVGSPSTPCGEVQSLQSQGWNVTVASASTWDSMSESQFASYQLLVFPDPDCGQNDSYLANAVSNESTWEPAVDGSILIIGTDPVFHESYEPYPGNEPDPAKLVYQGLAYAGAQPGKTGLYLDLSCYYNDGSPVPQDSAILDGLESGFTVYSANNCASDISVVAAVQQLIGVTNSDLSGWGCSAHEYLGTWPSDFVPYALYTDVAGGLPGNTAPCPELYTPADGSTAGCPYILARGGGISAADIGLAAPSEPATVGSSQTLTASVEDGGSPVSGASVDLNCVSGPDTGATATIVTDSTGTATYSYSNAVSGTDEWTATYTPLGGTVETSNQAAVIWRAFASSTSTSVNDVGTGDPWSGSESTGASADASSDVGAASGFTPTGTVTYDFYANGSCSGPPFFAGQVSLSSGTAPDSSGTGGLGGGPYSVEASYSGDSNYTGSTSSCAPFSVATATPRVTNVVGDSGTGDAWSGTESTDSSAYDSLVLGGVSTFPPTGTVTYGLFANGTCSGSPTWSDPVSLSNGSVPDSPQTAGLAPGPYSFDASYSGDSNYVVSDTCEPFSVAVGPSTTSSTVYDEDTSSPWSGSESTGAAAYATSTVGGTVDFTPTGTVTYNFFADGSCAGEPTLSDQVTLSSGTVPDSSDTAALGSGSYSFQASYSGDPNYTVSTGACEPFVVALALPVVSNAVSDAGTGDPWAGTEVTGAKAFDRSTISGTGSFTPTGTLTYDLFANGTCSGSPTSTQQLTLSGGQAAESSDTPALATGTYGFDAAYSGDSNFGATTSTCALFSVGAAATSVHVTSADNPSVSGGSVTFTAILTVSPVDAAGAADPTGTFEFQSSNDAGSTWTPIAGCGSQSLDWSDVSGSATSQCIDAFTAAAAGDTGLEVRAVYSGDQNFSTSTSSGVTQAVNEATTATVVGLSPLPSVSGQTVTAQATVTITSPGSDSPTAPVEDVLFQESANGTTWTTLSGCAAEPLSWNSVTHRGSALCTASLDASAAGLHVRAISSGDQNFNPSTSASAVQLVNQASTRVVPAIVPIDPVTGQPAVVQATLEVSSPGSDLPNAPTGSLAFQISTNGYATYSDLPGCGALPVVWNLGSGLGTATCDATFLSTDSGTSLRVQYSGDANFAASLSAVQTLTIGKADTTTDISALPSPVVSGQVATISANVSTDAPGVGAPAGSVDFTDGGVILCAHIPLSQTESASCETKIPVSPNQEIQAVYSGSPDLNGSTGTLSTLVPKHGYWLTGADGGVFSFGDANFHGSLPQSGFSPAGSGGPHSLNAPIVGIATTSDGDGYWLVGSDGGVFAFGDAVFYGSTGSMKLNAPIVGMVPTFDGKGYWLVASDGGVFAFGDAAFYGSTGSKKLNAPVVGIAMSSDGKGYWLVGSDGGVFAFGDAAFQGSLGGHPLSSPVTGVASTGNGAGYWLVTSKGVVYPFGDAANDGSTPTSSFPIVGVTASVDGKGYWLVATNGGVFSYGDALFSGSSAEMTLQRPIVGMSGL
jgi:Bacterial Ig-like domain (group 3)